MNQSLISLLVNIANPVSAETRSLLESVRSRLPESYHGPNQFLGSQYAGCGATIGAMPRCDFACGGCYLNREANRTPPESVERLKQQLRTIRGWLGEGGNVQITDGEVTLRSESEVIEILRFAKTTGLIPMIMSHGDEFRKNPGLLARLVEQADLGEVSIHIDTTQRGRSGHPYRFARREIELHPLRDEFANLIRSVRKQTGKRLEAATTVTVSSRNIDEVAEIIRWLCRNADAFKMISFQPVAQVGRTDKDLRSGHSVEELWTIITAALGIPSELTGKSGPYSHFGHPACTRFLQGLVVNGETRPPRFHPLFHPEDEHAVRFLAEFANRFAGISFRGGSIWERTGRALAILVHSPKFTVTGIIPFIWRNFRSLAQGKPISFAVSLISGRIRLNYLNIVSHHFMSRAEIETPLGRERLDSCVFKVPIHEELVSMCEVNAMEIREKYYAQIRENEANPGHRQRDIRIETYPASASVNVM